MHDGDLASDAPFNADSGVDADRSAVATSTLGVQRHAPLYASVDGEVP